jgi:hypothetical protein
MKLATSIPFVAADGCGTENVKRPDVAFTIMTLGVEPSQREVT